MSKSFMHSSLERRRAVALTLLAIFYGVAGYFHLATPETFIRVTPDWVRNPAAIVFLTGVYEIAAVVALLIPRTRKLAGVALSLYAICVYPANVQHAVQDLSGTPHGLGWLYHAPRLFAQPLIVWWSLYAAGVVGGMCIPPKLDRNHRS